MFVTSYCKIVDFRSVERETNFYDNFSQQVVKLVTSLDWTRLQILPEVFRDLAKLLRPCAATTAPCDVRKSRAIIHEPPSNSDITVKFPAGLSATVSLVASLENVEDTGRVSVLVRKTTLN